MGLGRVKFVETMGEERALKQYSMGEEIAISITHGIGIVLGIAVLETLVAFAGIYGDVRHIFFKKNCSVQVENLGGSGV